MTAVTPRAHHAFARSDRSPIGVWWWTVDHWILGAVALLIANAILFALPALGDNAKGATRWVEFGGFSLQPSEFMKPALVILVAWMFSEGQKGNGVPGVSIAFVLYLISVALLLIQPDIGQTVLITVAFGAAFWMAGVPISWVMGLGATAIAGLSSTYFLFPHVASRVDRFLSPDKADTHQVDAAAVAQAAGGLFGRGPGEGVLKRAIPDAHTDFAASVGAEEFGLVFLLVVISLFTFVVVRGLYRAMKLRDPFEQVAAGGRARAPCRASAPRPATRRRQSRRTGDSWQRWG